MPDQSHREEMNAAIRAQRERQAVPRSIAPEPLAPRDIEPKPEERQEPRRFLGLFRRK